MSTKNNSCNICYDTNIEYCITSEELNSAIASALSQLRSELEGLENQTYTKIEIDQMIQDLTMGNVDLSNYYTRGQIDGKFEWVYNRLNEIEGKTTNIDEDLSSTSTNPVQNKTLYYKFKEYYNKDQIDDMLSNVGGGGGGSYTVDSDLSSTSTNPVQNKIITENINSLEEDLQELSSIVDSNLSQLRNELEGIENQTYTKTEIDQMIQVDSNLSSTSTNPVQNKIIAENINSLEEDLQELNSTIDSNLSQFRSELEGLENQTYTKTEIDQMIQVDSDLSSTSTNPVQNKIITENINSLEGDLQELNSNLNQLSSDLEGLENQTYTKTEIDDMLSNSGGGDNIQVDSDLSSTSTNPVQNKSLYYKFKEYYNKDQIDDMLSNVEGGGSYIVDSNLSSTSTNPVQNKIITESINSLGENLQELNSTMDSNLSEVRNELEGLENQTYTKTEVDQMIQDLVVGNVDLSNYYTIPQVDDKFDGVYNKLDEIEEKTLNIDEDLSSTSTNPVQNKSLYYKFKDYYSKDQIDDMLSNVEGGGSYIVDSNLSSTSTNPVQNKIITENINSLEGDLQELTSNLNQLSSDLEGLENQTYTKTEIDQMIQVDSNLSSTSTFPVQNKIITESITSLEEDLQALQTQVGEIDTILNSVLYNV